MRHRIGYIFLGIAKKLLSPEAVGAREAAYQFKCGKCKLTVIQVLEPSAFLDLAPAGNWHKEPICQKCLQKVGADISDEVSGYEINQ